MSGQSRSPRKDNAESTMTKGYTLMERLQAAAFYGVSSIVIMMVNKYLLTVWGFPSSNIVALFQFCSTVVVLSVAKRFSVIDYPDVSWENSKEVFPLPLLYLLNTLCGLAGTQALSIPMFSVLRRLNMVLTLVLEYVLLNYTFSKETLLSLFIIMFGSVLAASDDLSFNLYGYVIVFFNNLFTSSSGVVSKMKLDKGVKGSNSSKGGLGGLGTFGLMFYNALFSAPLLLVSILVFDYNSINQVLEYPSLYDPVFIGLFTLSSIMGTVLQYSIFYCTKVNSALTTVVTGCIKNVLTTYLGMVAPGMDYTYSFKNFMGVNISMIGGLYYARVNFRSKQEKKQRSETLQRSKDTEDEQDMLLGVQSPLKKMTQP